MDLAIKMLGRNLRSILSALMRLQDRHGFGKAQKDNQNDLGQSMNVKSTQQLPADKEPSFPNEILLFLYRIAEFQVY